MEGNTIVEPAGGAAVPAAEPPRRSWYPHFVLIVLALTNALNTTDRGIVAVLLQPIKREFHASDKMMGLLTGFAFVIVYSLAGVPIARLADRATRRTILAIGVGVWSVMTALCGVATSFVTLALARAGVGVGEASGPPSSLSIISDYYPAASRARAVSIFYSASFAGTILGMPSVGWVAQNFGWRAAFMTLGVAGLPVALMIRFLVKEPPRGQMEAQPAAASDTEAPRGSLWSALKTLFSNPFYVLIFCGLAVDGMAGGSFVAWGPSTLIRTHHLTLIQMTTIVGPILGVSGLFGTVMGGLITTAVVKRTGDERWSLLIPLMAAFVAAPFQAIFVLAPQLSVCLGAGVVQTALAGSKFGPILALALGRSSIAVRGVAMAVLLVAINVVGGGAGPLIVGAVSDHLGAAMGSAAGLRYALLVAPFGQFVGAMIFFAAYRLMTKDNAAVAK